MGDADQGAGVVEHVDEEECEDDGDQADLQRLGDIELQKHRRDGRRQRDDAAELAQAERHAGDRCRKDADQDRARNASGIERPHQDEPERGQQHGRRFEVAECHQRCRVRLDDARALQPDDRQEQADARGDRHLEAPRDRVDHPFADGREAHDQEQDAREEHGAECRLPAVAEPLDDAVGEVCVEAHARRERHGVVGVEPHECGGESRGEAGGDEGGPPVHPCVRKDRRVDEDDVGHGHEGGQAGHKLGPDAGAVLLEFEQALEHVAPPGARQSAAKPSECEKANPCKAPASGGPRCRTEKRGLGRLW